jgi:hypothetical protein
MKKLALCVLAVLAGAVSTSAVAKDLKQNKQAPAVSATQMTDSKMDKVVASTFSGANNSGRLGSGNRWCVVVTGARTFFDSNSRNPRDLGGNSRSLPFARSRDDLPLWWIGGEEFMTPIIISRCYMNYECRPRFLRPE